MEALVALQQKLLQMIPVKNATTTTSLPSTLTTPEWLTGMGHLNVSLDAAGLLALADLSTSALRTVLTGTTTYLDALVLCPGLHRQVLARDLNKGEYPACAAMTTGYVFRVENQATVVFLQRVGRTACLTTLHVSSPKQTGGSRLRRIWRGLCEVDVASVAYALAVLLTLAVLMALIIIQDWWGLCVMGALILARLINVIVIRRQAAISWKGASEPGDQGDLLILLSQDRWVRMQGAVDDLKAVTSGSWLREPMALESALTSAATLLVYADAVLAGNARQEGKVLLIVLLLCEAALLGMANECTDVLRMYGREVKVCARSERYGRRVDLARQLVKETGRRDWAVKMGMLPPEQKKKEEKGLGKEEEDEDDVDQTVIM